jgi:hypothetical protein
MFSNLERVVCNRNPTCWPNLKELSWQINSRASDLAESKLTGCCSIESGEFLPFPSVSWLLLEVSEGFQDLRLTSGLWLDEGRLPDNNKDDLRSSLVIDREAARGRADGCKRQQDKHVVGEWRGELLSQAPTMTGRSRLCGEAGLLVDCVGYITLESRGNTRPQYIESFSVLK